MSDPKTDTRFVLLEKFNAWYFQGLGDILEMRVLQSLSNGQKIALECFLIVADWSVKSKHLFQMVKRLKEGQPRATFSRRRPTAQIGAQYALTLLKPFVEAVSRIK